MEPAVGVLLGRMDLPTLQDWTLPSKRGSRPLHRLEPVPTAVESLAAVGETIPIQAITVKPKGSPQRPLSSKTSRSFHDFRA